MKTKVLLFLAVILFESCSKSDNEKPNTERTNTDWIELIIPEGRVAYAIAGDITDTLLVTTWTCAYFTVDSGKTWQLSKDFQGPIFDLVEQNDTIFALLLSENELKDFNGPPLIENQEFTITCIDYTTDFGKTWTRDLSGKYQNLESPIGIAESPTGIVYKLKHDLNRGSNTINFSDIEMFSDSKWQSIDFPYSYELNNLHIDQRNHLYVSAPSLKYVEESNFKGDFQNYPGLIYYYKIQLP